MSIKQQKHNNEKMFESVSIIIFDNNQSELKLSISQDNKKHVSCKSNNPIKK